MRLFQANLLLIGILVTVMALIGFGCQSFFSNRSANSGKKISGSTRIGPEWLEISPRPPLEATSRIQFIGLKIKGVKAAADGALRLDDGSPLILEVQLVDENGNATFLFPNGVGEFAEFGKRTQNKENIEDAYFQIGEKFNKIRLRSDKPISADEIVWAEFEF